ncbi:6-pyruvoyl trahydropterin synthase family protein [Bernardetia sp.]|uniref:6-pyruvoyl trahydropterin synthase family protein n=1 Tax=Bernardetia sp. TaxID=1937974 RepID=UPI0025C05B26|nr:6-carboxytetrahydropterin synthase [Bernardetia sp.]
MVYLCRKEHFCASHRLFNPAWDDERNKEEFGICSNPYFHGHNFELTVKVKGKINPDTGCVLDLKKLGKLIRTEIIDKVDHKNLNIEVEFLKNKIPSCEIVIMEFWKILAPKVQEISDNNAVLHSLTLFETEKNYVEYFGEE